MEVKLAIIYVRLNSSFGLHSVNLLLQLTGLFDRFFLGGR